MDISLFKEVNDSIKNCYEEHKLISSDIEYIKLLDEENNDLNSKNKKDEALDRITISIQNLQLNSECSEEFRRKFKFEERSLRSLDISDKHKLDMITKKRLKEEITLFNKLNLTKHDDVFSDNNVIKSLIRTGLSQQITSLDRLINIEKNMIQENELKIAELDENRKIFLNRRREIEIELMNMNSTENLSCYNDHLKKENAYIIDFLINNTFYEFKDKGHLRTILDSLLDNALNDNEWINFRDQGWDNKFIVMLKEYGILESNRDRTGQDLIRLEPLF